VRKKKQNNFLFKHPLYLKKLRGMRFVDIWLKKNQVQ